MFLEKVLTVLGRTFIGAGILVFLFVGYQLWGTNLAEARHQNDLRAEAQTIFGASAATADEPDDEPGVATPVSPPNTTPAPPPAPQGSAVAIMKIPSIGLEKTIVEGTGVPDLKKAPGHYTNTPLPGQPGNAAIAGHRTTYGAPFGEIQELKTGDPILVTTRQGSFRYKVASQKIVSPAEVSVLASTKDNRLTLTTCHPKYSASKRLIVTAMLDTSPAPAAAPAVETTPPVTAAPKPGQRVTTTTLNPAAILSGADLSGTATNKSPAFIWGGVVAIVGLGIYLVGRAWRRWPAYLLGAPLFLLVLYIFFENFSRLLPANA